MGSAEHESFTFGTLANIVYDNISNIPRILRLDLAGQPIGWINWQVAVCLYARDIVSWTLGELVISVKGGICARTGERSRVDVNSIIACEGKLNTNKQAIIPPLNNSALFERDQNTCMYCGTKHPRRELTRDHVVPRFRGGKDTWENCVTACKRCNHYKGSKLLQETAMELLALPYAPNLAEYLALVNSSRILGDQMSFLETRFSKARDHRLQVALT